VQVDSLVHIHLVRVVPDSRPTIFLNNSLAVVFDKLAPEVVVAASKL
jgi:hypothetical protein